jgi:hypothetical protein
MKQPMKTLGHYRVPEHSMHHFKTFFGNQSLLPFQWAHCDITANTVAAYFSSFFPVESDNGIVGRNELTFSVNYVVNELLENAVKFGIGGTLELRAMLTGSDLLLWAFNFATSSACHYLETVVSGILEGDPQRMLLERIEQNALNPENDISGLGYLTMMSDYGIRFGWAFREQVDAIVAIETQAWLPVQRKD